MRGIAFKLRTMALQAITPICLLISSAFGGTQHQSSQLTGLSANIGSPSGIQVDNFGNLYFAGRNCIFKVDSQGVLTAVVGNGTNPYPLHCGQTGEPSCAAVGEGGSALNVQMAPQLLALDSGGNVYLNDGLYHIRKVSAIGIITTVAGNGYSGNNMATGDGGPAVSAALTSVNGGAVDSAGIFR